MLPDLSKLTNRQRENIDRDLEDDIKLLGWVGSWRIQYGFCCFSATASSSTHLQGTPVFDCASLPSNNSSANNSSANSSSANSSS